MTRRNQSEANITSFATRTSGQLSYMPQLDGLRAIAIFLVVGYHLGVPLMWGGFLGVDVFLVLSGFLITSILMRERNRTGRLDLPGFWLRRVIRLLPAVVVMAAVVVIYASEIRHPSDESYVFAALAAVTYTANLFIAFGGANFGALDQTWSLSLEEQFYLVWPLALIGLSRISNKAKIAVLATACIGSFVLLAMLASALLIGGLVSAESLIKQVLSLRPFVWVGKISY